ncbi:MAG: hypothetical protein AB3X44_20210 [Leptothrix sp. (in: b-proteobacteria)]
MGENHFESLPSAIYGGVLLMAAIAYYLLQRCIMATDGPSSVLRHAVGADWKGKASPFLYVVAIGVAFPAHWLAQAIYVLVALIWLVPDRRIERTLNGIEG